ncbi:lanthionine synthetase C family protein [Ulvibacterium sp.]|uniref:lanthionine synthetase C family protein n=1 Tax=Ulvibacterium sp. TaxID=2665914 RepID=UPI002605AAA9|nr:lanthionine synthetase C family protein [Ulvibacterium sp.]
MLDTTRVHKNRATHKEILEEHLIKIDAAIRKHYKEEKNAGVLVGLSGVSLFQFYYSKYLDVNSNANFGVALLSQVIEGIDDGYGYPTFCDGIAGAGWVLDHLEHAELMEIETDDLLSQLDGYLHTAMVSDMKLGNYDFLHGAIGYALYFLNRYKCTKSGKLKKRYRAYLLEFISFLDELSEKDEGIHLKWISIHPRSQEKNYNLGLSHGISGIIGILVKLCQYDEFKPLTLSMLKGAVGYVISFKKENNAFSLFPNRVLLNGETGGNSRLGWCYGELGIGLQLYYASKVLRDEKLRRESISILKHAADRTTPDKSLVKDAIVCHGSYGIAQIFSRVYKETKIPMFRDITEFWIQDGINKAIHKDGYAGYKRWRDVNEWVAEVSLLEGISGMGLVIIDYLADFETTWDECLMIS